MKSLEDLRVKAHDKGLGHLTISTSCQYGRAGGYWYICDGGQTIYTCNTPIGISRKLTALAKAKK